METFQFIAMHFAVVLYILCLTGFTLIFPIALYRTIKSHFRKEKTLS